MHKYIKKITKNEREKKKEGEWDIRRAGWNYCLNDKTVSIFSYQFAYLPKQCAEQLSLHLLGFRLEMDAGKAQMVSLLSKNASSCLTAPVSRSTRTMQ